VPLGLRALSAFLQARDLALTKRRAVSGIAVASPARAVPHVSQMEPRT